MHTRQPLFYAVALLVAAASVGAVKFNLQAARYPPSKCFWHAAHDGQLVVVTANVAPGADQRVDIEIVDASPARHVYQSKRGLSGEARFAITTHSEDDVGVCFKNYLDYSVSNANAVGKSRVVDLDVDIGADAVDYNAIANKESLSVLETEMRKVEGVVKEIVDEMEYLKRRELRFHSTNESTNARVQNFALFTLFAMLCLGAWEIMHLRAFFKRKYLID
ncbi:hypothetical protein EXIGLDRAFT_724978 [Exidia glandulosa HHB12029]|uniref:GOLD domain-containing protein n=1 Tax=Exidia glandulosa HHB12029 TaxID=1314781 RepID=A0A165K3E8_EXIGL|nr:hypothetical protein EXIGLDRAFT_834120 [Exidia glandulosa HHB12029]KZV99501.1 hypothetical protein EXIGLDRAFT_724978 [Exidia glandulosa HHB12029]